MDCGTSFAKYVLFVFNLLVAILGVLGIVLGVLVIDSLSVVMSNGQVALPEEAAIPVIVVMLCSIVVFISFLGCCGAIRESVCMTMTYAILLFIILIVQLTLVVFIIVKKDRIEEVMGQLVDELWNQNVRESGVFEALQQSLKCCGRSDITDYIKMFQKPPASCCEDGNCLIPTNIYGGCRRKVVDLISDNSDKVRYYGLGLIGIELLGVVFACCVANNVRNYKRRAAY